MICAKGKDSEGGPLLDIAGSLQLLHAPHVRERDKALLRGIMAGGVWNGFLLGHAREKSFRAAFVARLMEMGTSFGNVLTPLWFKYVKILSFTF